jgi:hypothetical protein
MAVYFTDRLKAVADRASLYHWWHLLLFPSILIWNDTRNNQRRILYMDFLWLALLIAALLCASHYVAFRMGSVN